MYREKDCVKFPPTILRLEYFEGDKKKSIAFEMVQSDEDVSYKTLITLYPI